MYDINLRINFQLRNVQLVGLRMRFKNIHRLAGVSLAGAVGLGALGQHKVKHQVEEHVFHAYDTANK